MSTLRGVKLLVRSITRLRDNKKHKNEQGFARYLSGKTSGCGWVQKVKTCSFRSPKNCSCETFKFVASFTF